MTRRVIECADIPSHKNPIPQAAIVRGVMSTSVIMGIDPASGEMVPEKEEQIALAFRHMAKLIEAAHGDLEDIVKVHLYFADKSDRPLVNTHWLKLFPDEHSRPARHAHTAPLPAGCFLQIEFMAILEE